MIPHLLRYQGIAVDDYGFTLDALNLGHPRLSLEVKGALFFVHPENSIPQTEYLIRDLIVFKKLGIIDGINI